MNIANKYVRFYAPLFFNTIKTKKNFRLIKFLLSKKKLIFIEKHLDFKLAVIKEANARNNALQPADKILKADPCTSGLAIKRKLGASDRGVTVNGVYAFA